MSAPQRQPVKALKLEGIQLLYIDVERGFRISSPSANRPPCIPTYSGMRYWHRYPKTIHSRTQ